MKTDGAKNLQCQWHSSLLPTDKAFEMNVKLLQSCKKTV